MDHVDADGENRERRSHDMPGKLDVNHLDGIGPLWLLAHLPVMGAEGPGYVDLDQAKVTIRFRAQDLDLKGARIVGGRLAHSGRKKPTPNTKYRRPIGR